MSWTSTIAWPLELRWSYPKSPPTAVARPNLHGISHTRPTAGARGVGHSVGASGGVEKDVGKLAGVMPISSLPAHNGTNQPDGLWGDPAFEQQVRDTAYFMWENDNRPKGHEKEYWFAALEAFLRRRNSTCYGGSAEHPT
jgi:hypothetical protein